MYHLGVTNQTASHTCKQYACSHLQDHETASVRQYLVGVPFASITAWIPFGIFSINFLHSLGEMLFHIRWIATFSSSMLLTLQFSFFFINQNTYTVYKKIVGISILRVALQVNKLYNKNKINAIQLLTK